MKASTGAFELIYKALTIQTNDRPVSNNQTVASAVSKSIIGSSNIETRYSQPATAVVIKNIGFGMRQTLEDLVSILKSSKQKKQHSKPSTATITSFTNPKTNQSMETVISKACIETQTLSKIKIMEVDSNNDLISSYYIKENKKMRNGETNTVKYTKEYVLEILKNKVNDSMYSNNIQ